MSGPVELRVSPGTTMITEPVHSSGYVDYSEEVNRCLQQGVDTDATMNELEIGSACYKVRALSPKFAYRKQLPTVEISEDLDSQLFALSDVLNANRGVLNVKPLTEADSYENRFWVRLDNSIVADEQLFLGRQLYVLLINAARMRLAEGERLQGIRHLRTVSQIQSLLLRQKTELSILVALQQQQNSLNDIADLLTDRLLSPSDVRELLAGLPRVDYRYLKAQMRLARIWPLAAVCTVHSGQYSPQFNLFRKLSVLQDSLESISDSWVIARADWNGILSQLNEAWETGERDLAAEYGMANETSTATAAEETVRSQPKSGIRRIIWSLSEEAATQRIQNLLIADPARMRLGLLASVRTTQRRRELLSAATYVVEFQQHRMRVPASLEEADYSAACRIPIDGVVAAEELQFSQSASQFELSIGTGDDEEKLRFTSESRIWKGLFESDDTPDNQSP